MAPEAEASVEAVRADLIEAAKVTGPMTLAVAEPRAGDDGEPAPAVAVTAVELGEAPAKPKKG